MRLRRTEEYGALQRKGLDKGAESFIIKLIDSILFKRKVKKHLCWEGNI